METRKKSHLAPEGQDLKEEETKAKMRVLWTILIVLVLALVAAIVYEIVLGNGMRQTGSERMEEIALESEMSGEAADQEMLMELPGSAGDGTDLQVETDAAAGTETEGTKTESAETEGAETEGTETEGAETEGTETEGTETEDTDTAAQQQGTGQQETSQTEKTVSGNEPGLAGIGGV